MNSSWHDWNLYWHLPILIVLNSLVYSATRYERGDYIFIEAFRWGLRMTIFLAVVAVVLVVVAIMI